MTTTTTEIRDSIADEYPDTPLLFMDPPEYDKAIIGVMQGFGSQLAVAYDFDKVIQINMDLSEMTDIEAIEWFEYNQVGAYVGDHTPVYIHTHNETKE